MSIRRRWTVHVPRIVGRLSYPQHNEQPHELMRRVVGEFDTMAQELQRFLRYLQDSQDEATGDGRSYPLAPEDVDASAASVGDPDLGWSPGSHKHKAAVGIPVGLGNANAEGGGDALSREDHIHKRDIRAKKTGADVATRNAYDFRDTATTTITVTDDLLNDEVDVSVDVVPGVVIAATTYYRHFLLMGA